MVPLIISVPMMIILLSGHSLAPNNPITATLWIMAGIWCCAPLIMGTPKQNKKRNMEEAEWYISNYKRIWFSKDQWQAIHNLGTYAMMSRNRDSYRGRKCIELYDDLWSNLQRKWDNRPLRDTYRERYGWMAINNSLNGDMYCPQYHGIVNNEEKLKAWEPSMKINVG